ncbi:MAG: patatin-like phospholipase family protein [Blastocatellia bacterium]|nr:patatin-like phospholipase family protein [Blastocatellia bacterium]
MTNIRGIGNQQGLPDLQDDPKSKETTSKESLSQPEEQPRAVSEQSQIERSLRSRTTLSSTNLRSSLEAALKGSSNNPTVRPLIGREFQSAVNNLVRAANRLSDAATNYRTDTQSRLNAIGREANNFIAVAKESIDKIDSSRSQMAGDSSLPSLDNLLTQLQNVVAKVQSETNNLLFNSNINLEEMTRGASIFERSAKRMELGDATAIKAVNSSFETVTTAPSKISTRAANYATAMDNAATPLAANAQKTAALLENSKNSTAFSLKGVVRNLADKAYKFVYNVKEKADSIIDEYVKPLGKALGAGVKNIWNSIFNPDKNPNGKAVKLDKLVSNTEELRALANAARAGDSRAASQLQQKYGYTATTAPKPGQMWLASNFVAGDLQNGQVVAGKFPTSSTRATTPADVNSLVFRHQNLAMTRSGNTARIANSTVGSIDEFKQAVAANRAKLGMPVQGGELIPVQLTLEGGGGLGKRYGAAFEEMYNLGVVPASVTGTSAGAIAASLIAGGLDPRDADEIAKDPKLKKFFDVTIEGAGIMDGREIYRYVDEKLRALTGIKDRPVTFADLPMPLYLITTKLADSQAPNDLTRVEDRKMVFSKENTPDTPVAMAVMASAAIPGAFDPVEFVDVATGRTIRLADGGVLDNFAIGVHNSKLPELGIQLHSPNNNHPRNGTGEPKPLEAGNLISGNFFGNAKIGLKMQADSGSQAADFRERNSPKPGTFILNIPVWNLQDFEKQNTVFEFEYNNKIDPALDKQTSTITQDFFRRFMDKLQDPNASATNLNKFPENTSFTRSFTANGTNWTANYTSGNDEVSFRSSNGKNYTVELGKSRIEDWLADDVSFGDIGFRFRDVIVDYEKFLGRVGAL